MIDVQGITKYYGDLKALDDVSFHVEKGEVLGFLGPNGAGKSTAMKVLTTFISASEGTASVDGFDVHAHPREVRARIGYLPETPPLYGEMTVEDYLKFVGRSRGVRGRRLKERLGEVVADCGLRVKLKSPINELSKGYRQRTGLAQALIHDPEVLILDEPTSGLDPVQILEIRKLIEKLRADKVIIFSTHILQEATATADRLVIVNHGRKIADGTVDELVAKARGSHSVRLLVKGADAAFTEALRNLAGVSNVAMLRGPQGYGRFELQVGGGDQAARQTCENIVEMVTARGLKVAELAAEKLTLEQVFINLLRKQEQGPAPIPADADATPAPPPPSKTPTERVEKPPQPQPETGDPFATANDMTGPARDARHDTDPGTDPMLSSEDEDREGA